MNENPCISVIVPVFNAEFVLSRCVDSILGQSYYNFELLLIDDGSSDRSGVICDEYAKQDERVRVIHQKNGGVSSARNRGLEEAEGDYLIFIDSDDWVLPDYFLSIQSYLGIYDILFLGLDFVNQDGFSTNKVLPPYMSSETNPFSDLIGSLFNADLLGYVISTVVRRSIVEKHSLRFKEGVSLHEDSLFCYDCCINVNNFVSLDQTYYKYVHYENEEKKTLSNSIPINYREIMLLKYDKIGELLLKVKMPLEKQNFIKGRLMYGFCSLSLYIAFHQKAGVIPAIRNCIIDFSEQDMVICSAQERILKYLIRMKNPYLIFIVKKIFSFLG